MISCSYSSQKKIVFHLGCGSQWPLSFANWVQKTIFKRLYFFFRTIRIAGSEKRYIKPLKNFFFLYTWLKHKLLILIESPAQHISLEISQKKVNWVWCLGQNLGHMVANMLWKNKENQLSQWVFFIFCMRYIFTSTKHVEIPEWKLKAKLARNTIFEGN